MDIIWSFGLIVILLIALNKMRGGKMSDVLNPVIGIVTRLLTLTFRLVVSLTHNVLRIGAGSVGKLPQKKEETKAPGPTPPRWKE